MAPAFRAGQDILKTRPPGLARRSQADGPRRAEPNCVTRERITLHAAFSRAERRRVSPALHLPTRHEPQRPRAASSRSLHVRFMFGIDKKQLFDV
jgi:hypothetical protein